VSRRKTKWQRGDALKNYWLAINGDNKFSLDALETESAWDHLFAMKLPAGRYHRANMDYFGFTKRAVEKRFEELKN